MIYVLYKVLHRDVCRFDLHCSRRGGFWRNYLRIRTVDDLSIAHVSSKLH